MKSCVDIEYHFNKLYSITVLSDELSIHKDGNFQMYLNIVILLTFTWKHASTVARYATDKIHTILEIFNTVMAQEECYLYEISRRWPFYDYVSREDSFDEKNVCQCMLSSNIYLSNTEIKEYTARQNIPLSPKYKNVGRVK